MASAQAERGKAESYRVHPGTSGLGADGNAICERCTSSGSNYGPTSRPALYEVTAYSHGCTLPRSGREPVAQRAANGRWPIADLTVAADTRIHPFGSEVLIEGLGFRRVHDRGADIVGRRLDLFVDSCREARRFGRRWLRVVTVPAETTTFSQGSAQ